MNLLAISIAPIYKDLVQGGSQKILVDALKHAARRHRVRLFCTSRKDNHLKFSFSRNFSVHPVLRFRPHFPFPYMTNPRYLSEMVRMLSCEARRADCIYIHADGFYFKHFLRQFGKPLITSQHDFLYPISIASSFLPEMDRIIVPSTYVKECMRDSVGTLFNGYMDRVTLVENGVDSSLMYREEAGRAALRKKLRLNDGDFCMLFPHRPEDVKGVVESLDLLAALRAAGTPARLLFLKHFDVRTNPDLRAIYARIASMAADRGVFSDVIYHDWVPSGEMRRIYSASDAVLNIGQFVESFGLVPIEAAMCETPVIAVSVGCLRSNLAAIPGIFLVDYGDVPAILRVCERIRAAKPDMRATAKTMQKRFSYKKMLDGYLDVFETTRAAGPMPVAPHASPALQEPSGHYRLAPWCSVYSKGIYDDYAASLTAVPRRGLTHLSSGVFPAARGKWFRDLVANGCVLPAKAARGDKGRRA
ncbi:MAG: glycosyltransferase family 4 protein [Elusimicrobia bacterium]|nr:glycosyltransferase family 4 protein [Elusimicrobiota bacterium]